VRDQGLGLPRLEDHAAVSAEPTRAERFLDLLHRHRLWLFALWLAHAFVIHYQFIGFMSWDGFGYRVTPMVELVKHGAFNAEKFNDWPQIGHTPFLELIHVPFLKVFGMKGLLIGFPLVLFPLSVAAVSAMIGELAGSKRAGTLGALVFVAIPMINQQPFTAYIDFAVAGVLAYWVFAMLRLRADEPGGRRYGRLAIATICLSMARSQGLYMVIVLTPILAYAMFGTREKLRVRFAHGPVLVRAAVVLAAACLPSIGTQIYKYYEFGSPIAPMQFSLLGFKIGTGVPIEDYFHYAGLGGSDLGSLAKGTFEGWVWKTQWPVGAFFAGRFMGAGLLFILAVLVLPVFLRHGTRVEKWLLLGGVLVSLLSKDFAVPRWSYTTMLAIVVILARALIVLAASKRFAAAFWAVLAVMLVHLARPEFDILQIKAGYISGRMNASQSTMFLEGHADEVRMLPNRRFKVMVIESIPFSLQLFGKGLTNEVVGTLPGNRVGPKCEGLTPFILGQRRLLFVDDQHFSRDCNRTCVVPWPNYYCGLWSISLPY